MKGGVLPVKRTVKELKSFVPPAVQSAGGILMLLHSNGHNTLWAT